MSLAGGSAHPLSVQIRVHHLNKDENLESVLFRVQKGWIVQFKLGPTLFGRKIKLFTNYPENISNGFKRLEYRELGWTSESINKGDDTALACQITFEAAGSFHYFFVDEESGPEKPNGSGFILVEPTLTYGPENEVLPLDCILCQTYLAKCLGPFPEWEQRLRVAKESGYNMVHITPIQELGGSNSSYSLRNQLALNPLFSTADRTYTISDVAALIERMRSEWKVMTIMDIVLNHSANESEWLREHPECAYNLENSPHLRPAYLLDRSLWYFSLEIGKGKWEKHGIPANITEEKHLDAIRSAMYGVHLCQTKICELFMVDVDGLVAEFRRRIKEGKRYQPSSDTELKIIQDPGYRRLKSTVNMDLALQMFAKDCNPGNEGDIDRCCTALRQKLEELNRNAKSETEIHISAGIENVLKAVRYERLDPHGPRLAVVSRKDPLVPQYFYYYGGDGDLKSDEELMYSERCHYVMAHNGWVMGDNPLRNFAEPGSNVYLRRELIAWGDSCKLRYGNGPEDCPYLWEHMTKYVQQMARTFHGLRLDNCHSTPIHVAEYLIDKAREVQPNLYVIAELFTSSEAIDNIFVNRLGISSLVREAMSAPDAHEEGRLVYRYGGSPVGAFVHPVVRPLTVNIAHAIFMDITHDNPCPVQTRSVYDLFPTAAVVTMACCATGSTRGYDELVPHHIHVVNENRFYQSWTDGKPERGFVNAHSGIIAGKRALNNLHKELGSGGYSQVFVDQKDADTIAITRHCPATHQSVILVARTSFSQPHNPFDTGFVPPLKIPGVIDEIILEGRLEPVDKLELHTKDGSFINGLEGFNLIVREHVHLYNSEAVEVTNVSEDGTHDLDFLKFPRGSVIAFRVSLDSSARAAILRIRTCVSQFGYRMRSYSGHLLYREGHDFESIIANLSLSDMNRVLFRCDAEERDDGHGGGVYVVPNYRPLVYCGLQGIMSELMSIHLKDDLGHPLCENLRQGDWLARYTAERLMNHPSTNNLGQWFSNVFQNLSLIPRYLVPCYFDSIITGAYSSILTSLWRKMSEFISEGSTFVKALALGSVILCGYVKSSPLPDLSPSLGIPLPPTENDSDGKVRQCCVTLSAGLPHFCIGYTRNWGRDTFISLRGLLLITGRSEDARYIILAYAGCLRHGLIPNLLDRGVNSRYNCRDAVWWWLQSIQDYTKMVPDGHKILYDKVSRLYPDDDSPVQEPGKHDQPLCEVIQEAIQRHFAGVKFRERNAGRRIDEQMTDNGFNNQVGVDRETGFVFGGNGDNCGTWMDKMGSSEKAGNKGKPATPRDGSAVEIVGLCMSTLLWLDEMFQNGYYPYSMVEYTEKGSAGEVGKSVIMTFREWANLLQKNFEKYFWIDSVPQPTDSQHVNRRGIYKDTHGASTPWADYQLRPNYCIAMVVAPQLFTPERAWKALDMVEQHLLGPLGLKTLDPSDWAYNGFYNNEDDSNNYNTARGFNYHQGPEWLWPMGYFLRAKLHFAQRVGGEELLQRTANFARHTLSNHFKEIQASSWKGLPELTNKDGAFCRHSCVIQAWSHATLLELLYDMDQMFSS